VLWGGGLGEENVIDLKHHFPVGYRHEHLYKLCVVHFVLIKHNASREESYTAVDASESMPYRVNPVT
jgi:hypothetical protein